MDSVLSFDLAGAAYFVLNLGQSVNALWRDGLPFWFAFAWRKEKRVVVSLHGHTFMRWDERAPGLRLLLAILRRARFVTVLGHGQRQRLLTLGLAPSRVLVVPNACDGEALEPVGILKKQRASGPARVLYLGNLVESKGYIEFLEAIVRLSDRGGAAIDAVLCGPILFTASCRASNEAAVRTSIGQYVERVNRSSRVRVRWIPGALDEAKRRLFEEAQIFVFPSYYPAEAQPRVLLEAMSAGCAIIASTAGEIRSTLGEGAAILLSQVTPEAVAESIEELVQDDSLRYQLASNGARIFQEKHTLKSSVETWAGIFDQLGRD